MKGKFIVLEGTDSSGKATQTRLLIKSLKAKGTDVKEMDFPAYTSFFGKLVAKYLNGEFGDKHELGSYMPSTLYFLDRLQFKKEMEDHLAIGGVLVSNRYTQSNIGFQGAKYEGKERRSIIKWIEEMESVLPQPNLVIFLDMELSTAQKLLGTKGNRQYLLDGTKVDIHEKDLAFQKKARETYLEYAATRNDWVVIDCARNGKLRSKEDIQKEIRSVVKKRLG